MPYNTFISAEDALKELDNAETLFIDCSFSLSDIEWGKNEFNRTHIPGAIYADLNNNLSDPVIIGVTGRHPLPNKNKLISLFSKWGIKHTTQVIVYDSSNGTMAAARLWWLLQWSGHANVAVLIGGKGNWSKKDYPLTDNIYTPSYSAYKPNFQDEYLVTADSILRELSSQKNCLIDSRTYDRYLGKNETIDPIAGHIPTAISKPFNIHIKENGEIADVQSIKLSFKEIGEKQPVFYCGSGVTAAFNILVYVHAENKFPKLYAGSWSEWINNTSNPVTNSENS